MKYIDDILKQLKLSSTAAAGSHQRLMYPLRDWYVLLAVGVTLLITFLLVSAYLFLGVSRGNLFVGGSSTPPNSDTVDRSLLRETLLFYEGEATEFKQLRKSPPTVTSPL